MMRQWAVPAALLLAVPVLLLWDRTPGPSAGARPVAMTVAPLAAAPPRRRVFGGAVDDPDIAETVAGTLADIPVVVGVVGRLPGAAVALVRDAAGRSRPVAVGGTTGGWRLDGLAADSAVFSRGEDRVRVRMAAGDPE